MADIIPIKANFDLSDNAISLGEYNPGDTIPLAHSPTLVDLGGTPLTNFANHLADITNPHSVTSAQVGAIPAAEKGSINGVAELDGGGKVPIAQIPATAIPSVHVVADAAARLALVVQEGDEAIQLDDGSHWIYDGTIWQARPNPSAIFGSEYLIASSAGQSVDSSTAWQTKLTLVTFSTLPLGVYRIAISYGWNHNSPSNDFEGRTRLNGVNLGEIHKQEPKDSSGSFGSSGTSQRYYLNRVHHVTISGTNTIQIQYRTDNAGTSSSIWDAKIEFWRVQ